ncbi:MAG: Holliday junction branch migration protein RuvA [Planctomycetota bacterium]|nr:Holliday junction branch migration protein RuvA [Planctomycetota bacterium]
MITRLSGQLERLDGQNAVIAMTGGDLAYEVMLPGYLAERLAERVGQRVTLVTLQLFESPNQGATFVPRLLGFGSTDERRFFELFTTVKGIGPRKAMRALASPPAAVAGAIAAKDARALTALPEIGKRLAETVIAELSGKVEAFLGEGEREVLERAAAGTGEPSANPILADAIEALMALGESRADSETLVRRACERAARREAPLDSVERVLDEVFAAKAR